jgi:hypothetical protein
VKPVEEILTDKKVDDSFVIETAPEDLIEENLASRLVSDFGYSTLQIYQTINTNEIF